MKTPQIRIAFAVLTALAILSTAHADETQTPAATATPAAKSASKKSKAAASKKKPKESVKKIAVGPSPTPSATPQIEPATSASTAAVESDDSDSVDRPIPRAKIESSDAPGINLEAGTGAPLGEKLSTAPTPSADAVTDDVADTGSVKDAAKDGATATASTVELHEGDEAATPAASTAGASATSPSASQTPKASSTESPAVATQPAAPELGKNSVSADQSLKWLLNGNARFVNKTFRADGRLAEDRMRSSTDQKPHAIILACSESISPPEIIFDQGIGEITTIRVAGPQLDASVISSLEQAVRNFDSHLILVLGHTQCSSLEGSPYIGKKQLDPHSKNEVEAALNADGIARDLTSKSAFLKARVDAKQLTIKSALYWVDTGKVKLY